MMDPTAMHFLASGVGRTAADVLPIERARPAISVPTEGTGEMREAPDTGRYKLWELEGSHCSIIGTCLDLDDLRRIVRKADVKLPPDFEDFDIHGYFVTHTRARSGFSKLVHKTLDRKYATQIERFRRPRSVEEIWSLWQQALTSGDAAGAYWALMTHKAVPRLLHIRAYNEVHMLSHLMGRSSRDDIRRLRELEGTCADLSERLAKTRARSEGALQERDAALNARDARIRALEAQLAVVQAGPAGNPLGHAGRAARSRDREIERLQSRFAVLERRIKVERMRARTAEGKLHAMLQPGKRPRPGMQQGPEQISIDPTPPPSSATPRGLDSRHHIDMQGRAVLYVGGYPHVAPLLRAHAERMNASFLYHDGGIEVQNGKLPGLVSQAHAVFCPVGCVSHDACLRLKHLCKRQGKRYVLLRSAGLSSFMSALADLVVDAPAAAGG